MELMLVVAIIGLLVAIASPTYLAQGEKARSAKVVADLKCIKNLVELYRVEYGRYPLTDQFKSMVKENGFLSWGDTDGFLDPWARPYHYQIDDASTADQLRYVIWSDGPAVGGLDNYIATESKMEPQRRVELPTMMDLEDSPSDIS